MPWTATDATGRPIELVNDATSPRFPQVGEIPSVVPLGGEPPSAVSPGTGFPLPLTAGALGALVGAYPSSASEAPAAMAPVASPPPGSIPSASPVGVPSSMGPFPFPASGGDPYAVVRARIAAQEKELERLKATAAPAEAAAQDANTQAQQELAQIRAEMGKEHLEEPPTVADLPELPNTKVEPFFTIKDPSLIGALTETLNKLAVIVPMFTGQAPQEALAAYGGALAGWAEGSQEKAEQHMRDYGMKMQRVLKEAQLKEDHWRDLVEKHGANMQQLQAMMGVSAAEAGLAKEKVDLATKSPLQFLQAQNQLTGELANVISNSLAHNDRVRDEYLRWKIANLKAGENLGLAQRAQELATKGAARTPEEEKEYRNAITRLAMTTGGVGMMKEEAKQAKDYVEPLINTEKVITKLKELKTLLHSLDRKGLVPPAGGGPMENAKAWLARWQHPNDPDLIALQKLMPNIMIGVDRSQFGDVGVKVGAMFQAQFDAAKNPPSAEAGDKLFDTMRDLGVGGMKDHAKALEGFLVMPTVGEQIRRHREIIERELKSDATVEIVDE